MKRYGNLFDQITDFNNLFISAKKAQRGKRFRENVLEFNYHFEEELRAQNPSHFGSTLQRSRRTPCSVQHNNAHF